MNATQTRVLHEYSALEYILLGDLCDLLDEPADEQNCRWMLAVLDALLDTLPREFDLEEEDGYLSEVLEHYPSWEREVERLRREHESLFARLKTLRNTIVRQASFSRIARQVRRELRDWIDLLTEHHRRETRLLQKAMNLEVGGES